MSNPVSFSDRQTDYKNGVRYTAGISVDASASYVRDGSKVIITVTMSASGWGHYSQAHIAPSPDGSAPAGSAYTAVIAKQDVSYSDATWTGTYTYDDPTAKTYSFYIKSYVHAITGYNGQWSDVYILTIDVPTGGAVAWVKVEGQWRKGAYIYTKVNNVWTKGIAQSKDSGIWKM